MNLTAFAIKKNRISLSLLAIVVLLGLSMYKGLPRDSMPPYVVRAAAIVSSFPGANPQRVELLVSKKHRRGGPGNPGSQDHYLPVQNRTFRGERHPQGRGG